MLRMACSGAGVQERGCQAEAGWTLVVDLPALLGAIQVVDFEFGSQGHFPMVYTVMFSSNDGFNIIYGGIQGMVAVDDHIVKFIHP